MSFLTCRTHSRITADVVGSTCAGETTQAASTASSVVIIGFFCSPIFSSKFLRETRPGSRLGGPPGPPVILFLFFVQLRLIIYAALRDRSRSRISSIAIFAICAGRRRSRRAFSKSQRIVSASSVAFT